MPSWAQPVTWGAVFGRCGGRVLDHRLIIGGSLVDEKQPPDPMASVRRPDSFSNLRGQIGGLVYKWYGKRLVVTRAPRPSRQKPTAKKRRSCAAFAEASRYAEQARRQPALWAKYAAAAKQRKIPVRALAISDFRSWPKFHHLYLSPLGDPLRLEIGIVMADKFPGKTVRLDVVVRRMDGSELARGSAAPQRAPNRWDFVLRDVPLRERLAMEFSATDRFERTTTARYSTEVRPGVPPKAVRDAH